MNTKDLGVVLGGMAAVTGLAYARSKMSGSLAETYVPPPPSDADPKRDFKLQELEHLEHRMNLLRKDPRGVAYPFVVMRNLKSEYVSRYHDLFGEDPRPDDLQALTGFGSTPTESALKSIR